MIKPLPLLLLVLAWPGEPDTRFEQVYPAPMRKDHMERSPGQKRAVLLIPGLKLHSFSNLRVHQAALHDWQMPNSHLVLALGKQADVYAFGYAQNLSLEKISQMPSLASNIRKLQFLGYSEIVLVGHSAGGLIARVFVEDNPEAGVTRVIQICTPNLGSSWAKVDLTVRKDQEPFLHSLTKVERLVWAQKRVDRKIPENVEFLCVVGTTGPLGDGLVSPLSQWPEELQNQGIPAIRLSTTHFTVMHLRKTAEKIAELVGQNFPRWNEEERQARKKNILGLAGS
jgi:pimeloyl-ACP methyl ester carboxylesterase